VRPDLAGLPTSNVNFEKESSSKDKKYMFFKTALSIQRYEIIKMVKAFILDTAFKTTTK
jgi:hypothetical protein